VLTAILAPSRTLINDAFLFSGPTMTDYQKSLLQLKNNLNIRRKYETKHAGSPPQPAQPNRRPPAGQHLP
jgi:hypothetical protein